MNVPDTSFYMYLGYGVIFGVMAVYLVSLFARFRMLKDELATLSQLDAQEKRP